MIYASTDDPTTLYVTDGIPAHMTRRSLARKRMSLMDAPRLRAGYDVAGSGTTNANHWAAADAKDADAVTSDRVRKTIRQRARYEIGNNCYAKGMVLTRATDVVGRGPRLQLHFEDPDVNRRLEASWARWCRATKFGRKLRTMVMAKLGDGETFALPVTSEKIKHPVKLDLRIVEADQCSTPFRPATQPVDGIVLDENGEPQTYHILRSHPGSSSGATTDKDDVDASQIIHWFRCDRPGQHRGVTEIGPALPLLAIMRRYTLAAVTAMEASASVSGVIYTDSPAAGESAAIEPMEEIPIERNMWLTLPDGWKMGQVKNEQPGDQYTPVKRSILNEIARVVNMPINVASMDSSQHNYSSGRLDHQGYERDIEVERSECEEIVLDVVIAWWWQESILVLDDDGQPLVPIKLRKITQIPHQWFWPGRDFIDPVKEAMGERTRLGSGTTTLPEQYAKRGLDYEEEQYKAAEALGVTIEQYRQMIAFRLFGPFPNGLPTFQQQDSQRTPENEDAQK